MHVISAVAPAAHLRWNIWADLQQVFAYHFMVNALLAGTISAVLGGVVGWFMVLRRQTFAGHTLSVVAFPGAAGAVWIGISSLWGYYGFCITAAVVIGLGSGPSTNSYLSSESALIGVVQAFALACGYLFVALFGGFLNETESLLFGTFLGVSDAQVLTLATVALAVLVVVAVSGRRLFFASVDPVVATSQGVAARWFNLLFLIVLGVAVAEVSQVTGALLVFALLVMPSAAAQRLTSHPGLGIALSVVLALAVAWVGLVVSYFSIYPSGFWITTVGFVVYVTSAAGNVIARTPGRSMVAALQ